MGLLQRAKHKRCIRLATVAPALCLPGDQAARLSGKLARLLGGDRVRQRRRRNVEGSELLDHPANPLRVRLLVDPVDGRDAAALEELSDTLVREDHQLLDQPVGLGLRDRVGAGHPSVLEPELGFEALHLERGAGAAAGESHGRLSGEGQRLGDRPRGPRTASKHLVELVVVEAHVRADQAAVEAGRKRLACLRELDLRGDREAIPLGSEAARVARERERQHRCDPAGNVGGVRAAAGLLFEGSSRPNVGRHVGDVDPEAHAALGPRSRDSVVEVVGARRIDGEGRQISQVLPVDVERSGSNRRLLGLLLDPPREADPHLPVLEHRVEHIRCEPGITELANDAGAAAALAELDQCHPARRRRPPPAAELDLAAALEEQLADQKPAALGDEDHPPLTCLRRAQSFWSSTWRAR